jgi:MinD superfamily P-loop ATPase
MSYKIAIASGKGGTGKTTVSVNLYRAFHNNFSKNIQLVDCDVEEPNDSLFFEDGRRMWQTEIHQRIPVIHNELCTYCRKCADYCEFNAIVVIPQVEFAEVEASLCHSCGACLAACTEKAITEKPKSIGYINHYDVGYGKGLTEGSLTVGSAMQTMLIRELKKKVDQTADVIIYDAPPGTSCPVVETISDVDFVVLVTEPTPFGLNDLRLMVDLLKNIQMPFGVIVNKAGLGDDKVLRFLREQNIEMLGEVPFDKQYAGEYAKGDLFTNSSTEIENSYSEITTNIERKVMAHEGDNYFKW